MSNQTKYLTVLDSLDGSVSIYRCPDEVSFNKVEEYIMARGHLLEHTQWLCHRNKPVLYTPDLAYDTEYSYK